MKDEIAISHRWSFRNALADLLDFEPGDPRTRDRSHNDPVLVRSAILLTRIAQLQREHSDLVGDPALATAKDLLEHSNPLRWIELRQAERLIYGVFDLDETEMALARLYSEREKLTEAQETYYSEQIAALKTAEGKQDNGKRNLIRAKALLRQLSEDLHVANAGIFRKRWSIVKLRSRKLIAFQYTFLMFVVLSGIFVLAAVKTANPGFSVFGFDLEWVFFVRAISDPLVAIFAGAFGAAFSMLAAREQDLEDLSQEALDKAMKWSTLRIRIMIGVGGSLMLYYFLLSDVLQQSLLPPEDLVENFVIAGNGGYLETLLERLFGPMADPGVPKELFKDFATHAKLTVFSFGAGFSERLVPGVVEQLSNVISVRPQAAK